MSQRVRLKMIDDKNNAHYFEIEESYNEYIVYRVEWGVLTNQYT